MHYEIEKLKESHVSEDEAHAKVREILRNVIQEKAVYSTKCLKLEEKNEELEERIDNFDGELAE